MKTEKKTPENREKLEELAIRDCSEAPEAAQEKCNHAKLLARHALIEDDKLLQYKKVHVFFTLELTSFGTHSNAVFGCCFSGGAS